MNRSTLTAFAAGLIVASGAMMLGLQGPGDAKPADRPADPKALRERLVSQLENSRRLQERLRAEIDRIDKGEAVTPQAGDKNNQRTDRVGKEGMAHTPPEPLTPAEKEQLVAFMREHMPRVAARLTADKDPNATDRVVTRFAPRFREMISLKASDPKLFGFRVDEMRAGFDVFGGARELNEAIRDKKSDAEVAQIEAGIKDAVGRRFDAQLASQKLELESLGERVNHLKAEIDRKESNRDTAVNEEAAKLIERARKMDAPGERHRGHKPEDGKTEQPKGTK